MNGDQETVSTPRPDPTERTKQELLREITHLRELVEAKIDGHAEFSATRYIDLQRLVEQRVDAVENQSDRHLGEARQQLLDQIAATQRATDTAMVAATKAVEKAEVAMQKQIDALQQLLQAEVQSLGSKVDSVEQRINRSEGKGVGFQQSWGAFVAVAGVLVALLSIGAAAYIAQL